MVEKLDIKDRKLIYELDLDCSRTLGKIAKKIGMSKEATAYRIKRLEKRGILLYNQAILNLPSIGLAEHALFLKLSSAEKEETDEMLKYLVEMEKTYYVATTGGKYDIMLALLEKDMYDFEKSIQEIITRFHKLILDYDISVRTSYFQYSREYLLGKGSNPKETIVFEVPAKPHLLDKEEKVILKQLTLDSKRSIYDISEATGIPPSTVRYKTRGLEKKKIIIGYKAWFDETKLGRNFAVILIKTRGKTKRQRARFLEAAKKNETLIAFVDTVGRWDGELYISFSNIKEAHDFVLDLRHEFKDHIKEMEILMVFDALKLDYFPFNV